MECVSCVIVTYNTDEGIFKVIESVHKQVSKIIIVDNGSNNNTKEMLRKVSEKYDVDVIYNGTNLGIATALNIGIKEAIKYNSKWILTFDHDSIVTEGMIPNMLNCYNNLNEDKRESVGILAPEILDVSINKHFYKVNSENDYEEEESIIQSGALINIKMFEKIGFFNEDLFIYFVDTEFCMKVIYNGYKILMIKGTELLHEEGKRERRKFCGLEFTYDNFSIQAIYYISRNAIYMFNKYREYKYIDRIIHDFTRILLAEPRKLKYLFMGIKDGLIKKYGKKTFKK